MTQPKFIGRFSNHIAQDIERGWSSWNFGQEGFKGTKKQLDAARARAVKKGTAFCISMFEFYGSDIMSLDIRELYEGYWVLVDNENGGSGEGIFGTILNASTTEEAIEAAKSADYSGDGYRFDPSDYELISSIDDEIHVFMLVNEY
jgi:hypothetical protein